MKKIILITFISLFLNCGIAMSEDNNPYTNPGKSTTEIETPPIPIENDKNDDGTRDSLQVSSDSDNYKIMDGKTTSDDGDGYSNKKSKFTLLQPLPTAGGEELKENVSLAQYLNWVYKFALAMAGFLAVMQITIGGVMWIASGASEKLKSEAQSKIENALWGLVLAFAAYLMLYIVNPDLVDFENNWFFKEKETTTSSSADNLGEFKGGGGGKFRGGESSSPVTDIKDLDFNFSSSSGNTGGATGTW